MAPHVVQALDANRDTLTAQEERTLLRSLHTAPPQDALLLELYYYSGCRVSEALKLRRYHLDSKRCLVVFKTLKQTTGKYARALAPSPVYREVPIPRHVMKRLLAIDVADDELLFDIHRTTALRRLKDIMHDAKIPAKLANIRALRHCYCERGIRRDVDKRIRDALMGHRPSGKDKSSNDHYGNPRGRDLRRFAKRMGGWTWAERFILSGSTLLAVAQLPIRNGAADD
ncbi:tyrosine-type recombinase/integrase (plasmid) [Roseibium porphyridii]|uniref:Tyrosine-type recombinase/integrase n=1 Tax=Roseibium porphyridii TaxID=2866279 RepID=A0ABY8FEM9_9HYPH|nr:tyrosine-type recombinase/integrase [Roseibium sp. KMA01]WFE92657.1 tyrosine-type recombinase/integrase [Roseibium sp. KMA01]